MDAGGVEISLDLTFAELAAIAMLLGPDIEPLGTPVLGVEPAVDGSVEARAGVASLVVRGLLEADGDDLAAAPAVALIAAALAEPETLLDVRIDQDEHPDLVVFHLGDRGTVIHRRITPGIHRFSLAATDDGPVAVVERLGRSVLQAGGGELWVRTLVVDGGPINQSPARAQLQPGVESELARLVQELSR